jgi:hypothetical protein
MLAISSEKRREVSAPPGNKHPAVCQVSAQNLQSVLSPIDAPACAPNQSLGLLPLH